MAIVLKERYNFPLRPSPLNSVSGGSGIPSKTPPPAGLEVPGEGKIFPGALLLLGLAPLLGSTSDTTAHLESLAISRPCCLRVRDAGGYDPPPASENTSLGGNVSTGFPARSILPFRPRGPSA
jgi:hypothetical protein